MGNAVENGPQGRAGERQPVPELRQPVLELRQSVPELRWSAPARPVERRPGLQVAAGLARLGANESPYGPIPEVAERMAAAFSQANRYPDPTGSALRGALGNALGVRPGQILLGNGSSELIHTLIEAFAGGGGEVVIPDPSFPLYAASASYTSARVVRVPVNADGTADLEGMARAVAEDTRLVIVCNPNNPTGGFLRQEEIAAFLARVPSEVAVVLDEAYWELTDAYIAGENGSAGLFERFPNAILLRTFSKFYGLAGLRVGYAVACCEEVADRLSTARPGMMLNAVGLAAAQACVELADAYMERARSAAKERRRVVDAVRELGYPVYPTQTNFYCFPFEWGDGPFREAGLMVRGGESILMPGHVRISLGAPEDNDKVLSVLRRFALQRA